MLRKVIVSLLFIGCGLVNAQKQANYWYFGDHAGLRFDGGGPVPELCGQLVTQEGCAAYSDPLTGQLYFYTDGATLWDASHNVMSNGSGLLAASGSTSQSSVVFPMPGNDSLYYLFLKEMWDGPFGYCVINMKANGGLGAVVTKNVVLQNDSLMEGIAATKHANGIDYWVILHGCTGGMTGNLDSSWSAFLVTAAGVNPVPVVTQYGMDWGVGSWCGACNVSQIDLTQDGKTLAMGTVAGAVKFDNATGKITGTAAWTDGGYGQAFSPDGTKLYISGGDLIQYDMTAGGGNPDSIYDSRVVIWSCTSSVYCGNSLQLGPDGKIYHARLVDGFLGVIHDPNALGAACNYVHDGIYLGGKTSRIGLPNFAKPVPLFTSAAQQATSFLGNDTSYCSSISMTLSAAYPTPASYLWSTGDTTQEINVNTAGTYIVTVTLGGCTYKDTIVVSFSSGVVAKAGPDTTILQGSQAQLHGSGGGTYTWSPAIGLSDPFISDPSASPDSTTTYYLTVKDSNGCSATDTITVFVTIKNDTVIPCQDIFVPSAFSPNGDGQNEILWIRGSCIQSMEFSIFNRWGEMVFHTSDQLKGWEGDNVHGEPASSVYAYHLSVTSTTGETKTQRGNIALIR